MKSLFRRVSQKILGEVEFEEFQEGPLEGSRNAWAELDATTFHVRGKNYLNDRVKKQSDECLFDILDVEIFNSTFGKVENYAERPESAVQKAKAKGDKRFKVAVVFQTMTIHLVVTWAVVPDVLAADARMKALWEKYLHGDTEFRSERFKVIPRIADGGFILRRLVGEKPGLLGKKLQFQYYQNEEYLEVSCDTAASAFANRITSACMDQASKLTIDLGFLLEATSDDELPERLFGAFRMAKPNLTGSKKLDKVPRENSAATKAVHA